MSPNGHHPDKQPPPVAASDLAAHVHDLLQGRGLQPLLTVETRAEAETAAAWLLAAYNAAPAGDDRTTLIRTSARLLHQLVHAGGGRLALAALTQLHRELSVAAATELAPGRP